MPITPTYPGVYIEEIPSGVRTIAGVATSVAAFVDYFPRGPMNQAVEIFSYSDFERTFGGLDVNSEASYAIQQFFLNGGTDAWVVRVASGTHKSAVIVLDSSIPAMALTVTAASQGAWGDNLRVAVSWPDASHFDLTVSEVDLSTGAAIRQETFRGLVMATAAAVVNQASQLVTVTTSGADRPVPTGTVSGDLGPAFSLPSSAPNDRTIKVTFDRLTPVPTTVTEELNLGQSALSLEEVAGLLQSLIRAKHPTDPAWSQATVRAVNQSLQLAAGPAAPDAFLSFAAGTSDPTTVGTLKLTGAGVNDNVALYSPAAARQFQGLGTPGDNGTPPDANALLGSQAVDPPTGMFALDKVSLFNILCLPRIANIGPSSLAFAATDDDGAISQVISTATAYCDARRAFLILDTPSTVNNLPQVKTWLTKMASLRDKNVAFYFPRVEIADPLSAFRPRSFGASGTLAGLYARTDAGRGVWKAPAGTEAVLRGVQSLDYTMTDAENGALNPLAINCLRNFPVYGNVCWGARTLDGSDQQASEWKYIPVRRLALFLEESLYRGTQWVVFEPNDEPLWSQIRLNVGAFMHNLFRQGAFQGSSPREAYLVKCDRETTTQNDIDLGIVNIVVGFAPLKPAEFVIIKIQQLAPQLQT